ncbi:hypothetical protein CapIbe_012968 [Capra ibex]
MKVGCGGREAKQSNPEQEKGNLLDPGIELVSPAILLHYRQILYCWVTGVSGDQEAVLQSAHVGNAGGVLDCN